jgi:hypothetical protein
MKPKKRGGVTFETPHEESEGRNFGMIISPKDRLITLINKGRLGEDPGLGDHLTH